MPGGLEHRVQRYFQDLRSRVQLLQVPTSARSPPNPSSRTEQIRQGRVAPLDTERVPGGYIARALTFLGFPLRRFGPVSAPETLPELEGLTIGIMSMKAFVWVLSATV